MRYGSFRTSKEHNPSRPVEPWLTQKGRPRAWRVIHACEYARDVLPVLEAQIAAGMRPYVVTPQGAGSPELYLSGRRQEQPRPLSLLRSWQDVRNWRKSILDCDPENSADLVHAHCFAAGMAAVRNIGGVVYDLSACIEELAVSAGQCEPGSWMARSFRVAEQFILSRAAAVVVHSLGMREAAEERGTPPDSIFLIPDPLPFEEDAPLPAAATSNHLLRPRFGLKANTVAFLVPQFTAATSAALRPDQLCLLESFALALNDTPGAHLLVEGEMTTALRGAITEHASRLGIADDITLVHAADSAAAWQCADVVIATGDPPPDALAARRANEVSLAALCRGKALLAADLPRNRDASPEGRGCLWFERHNLGDLAFRIGFLGRNPGFRTALAAAGRSHILETRSSAAIGEKYRETYLHAFSRKRSTGPGTGMASLRPAANWS